MTTEHPYKSLHDSAFWRRSVATPKVSQVDPVLEFPLKIGRDTKVATAGSCFAQHIARHLRKSGFNYYVAEPGHPIVPEWLREEHNYGLFSARYGNIYTARQLIQLFRRAYRVYAPVEAPWTEADGSVLDPFRPTTQPGGYISVAEMERDREQHLGAVRKMFETLDVFVFTLGLTECWVSREDGAAFPLCPGVEGGVFDPGKYVFYNQTVTDVVADMNDFIDGLKTVNPSAKVILTVSPVPLMATARTGVHVLSATTYSKAVLRVAAETLTQQHADVFYFPSYEIVTGAYNRGRYFAEDLRNVTEEGVSHVMRLFLAHVAEVSQDPPTVEKSADEPEFLTRAAAFDQVECDEVALDRSQDRICHVTGSEY